ncbi:MAG: hypothetical protein ACKOUU_11240 [Acinetobacter tjernbergiae]
MKKENPLKIVRDYINYGSNRNMKRRHLKKLLKPLIQQNEPEAILLFSTLPSHQSDQKMAYISLGMAKEAAKTGFPPAISHLAEIYYNEGNYAKCYPLYHQAADMNEPHALYVLSAVYKFGLDGFEEDLKISQEYEERAEKAKKWDFIYGYNDEYIMYE